MRMSCRTEIITYCGSVIKRYYDFKNNQLQLRKKQYSSSILLNFLYNYVNYNLIRCTYVTHEGNEKCVKNLGGTCQAEKACGKQKSKLDENFSCVPCVVVVHFIISMPKAE
jgi:hypothetical protein